MALLPSLNQERFAGSTSHQEKFDAAGIYSYVIGLLVSRKRCNVDRCNPSQRRLRHLFWQEIQYPTVVVKPPESPSGNSQYNRQTWSWLGTSHRNLANTSISVERSVAISNTCIFKLTSLDQRFMHIYAYIYIVARKKCNNIWCTLPANCRNDCGNPCCSYRNWSLFIVHFPLYYTLRRS